MSTTRADRGRRGTGPVAEDDYLDLVKQFRLRPIRTEAEMRVAGEILDLLVGRADLTPGQRDYLEALARFARDFEEQNYRNRLQKLTPVEVLKNLMTENRMNTSDLGAVLGSRGLASEVLNGKRGLSKTLIAKLARRFRVDPSLFLETAEEQE